MTTITIDRAVVEQALEALENAEDQLAKPYSTDASKAITALRAALAQQAEAVEPVAYIHRQGNHWEVSERHLDEDEKARGWTEEPLYTAPPQRKPLTEGALMGVYIDFDRTADTAWSGVEYLLRLCRAVERAHGIPMPETPRCTDCRGIGYDSSGQLCACQQNPSFG